MQSQNVKEIIKGIVNVENKTITNENMNYTKLKGINHIKNKGGGQE